MFENIGEKIKNLVTVIFVVEAAIFAIIMLVFFAKSNEVGMLISVAGIFLSWVSSFVVYGFGELIDNSQKQTKQNDRIIRILTLDIKEDTEKGKYVQGEEKIKKMDSAGFEKMSVKNNE